MRSTWQPATMPGTCRPRTGRRWLCRGVDLDKDQSYVLFGISPARLDRMLLPIGSYRKPEIRSIAAELGLRVAEKRDSQEICFVPDGKHDEFVRARRGDRDTAGRIVTTDGRTVGEHIRASSVSRSASARDWEWRWGSRILWSASTR